MLIKLVYWLSNKHHFNFLTSVILLQPFPMSGIMTSFWNEVKSYVARLGGGWKSWLSSLDQTLGEALRPVCLKENSWFHHSNIASPSLPQLIAPTGCSSQKSKSHPSFTYPLLLGPFYLTAAGPVDSTYKIYLKAIHFSPFVLFPPLCKLSWSLAPMTMRPPSRSSLFNSCTIIYSAKIQSDLLKNKSNL